MGYGHTNCTLVQWLSSVYNQLTQIQARWDFNLVQGLSSEIKLRICTAPGMTKYPHALWVRQQSNITKETLNLTIAPTMGRPVSGATWGSARHGDQLNDVNSVIRWASYDRGRCVGLTGNSVEELWTVFGCCQGFSQSSAHQPRLNEVSPSFWAESNHLSLSNHQLSPMFWSTSPALPFRLHPGHSTKQLYSSSDTVGAPQLDLWG